MKSIQEGDSYIQSFVVNSMQTAKYLGSGNLDVFATPAMIACMENTALKLLQKSLPEGADSVGTEINTKHIKASIVGDEIVFEARIIQHDDKKVVFEISATNQDKICIGTALHTRYIVDVEKFLSRLGGNK
jgi:fluoroacetyl-CoA thioesterase